MNAHHYRITGLIAAAVLATGLAACTRSPVGAPIPNASQTLAQPGTIVRRSSGTITIEEFKDLPQGHYGGYVPTALALRGNALWVADTIDQDAGPSAIVRISPSAERTKTIHYQNDAFPSFEAIAEGPNKDGVPTAVTTGTKGDLWFIEGYLNEVGRVRILGLGQRARQTDSPFQ
ncbi:MAG TPA: hypothetical protein VHX17_09135 [Candidatus Cybelea sp.]|nr:hypothetical protein [Candidatus Cybelea sp.]